jgi:hypothetical protein
MDALSPWRERVRVRGKQILKIRIKNEKLTSNYNIIYKF